MGSVSGVPGGTISSYAATNAADTSVTDAVNAMHAVNNTDVIGDSGDQKQNQLGWSKGKGSGKGAK